jgi:hypothetical protein
MAHTFTSEQLARMTFDTVDNWYRQGCVTQDQYEGYRHAWATHPAHEGYSLSVGWTDTNFPTEVLAIAAEILAAVSERVSR